jgi:hypothetical protein
MTELLAGIVVAFAVLAIVLEPLVRGRSRPLGLGPGVAAGEDLDFSSVEESESPKIQALLAIKEIEFDRETGKLSEEDYVSLKTTYQRAALAAIEAEEKDDGGGTAESAVAVCPVCGPRSESSARFCSDCGRPVKFSGVSLRCGVCGVPAPQGAKFCGECGASL